MRQGDQLRLYDGLTIADVQTQRIDELGLGRCNMCGLLYSNGMNGTENMITYDFLMNGDAVCYHCLFRSAYPLEVRANLDGAFGMTIYQYVMRFKSSHDVKKCRYGDSCFLCDCLAYREIRGIIDEAKLLESYPPERRDPLAFFIKL